MIKKINIIKYGKNFLKMLMMEMEHEKIRLIDGNFPIEKIFTFNNYCYCNYCCY